MNSPYGVTIRFILQNGGEGDQISPDIQGLDRVPQEDDTIYINNGGYKVESSILHITTKIEIGQFSVREVMYLVYVVPL